MERVTVDGLADAVMKGLEEYAKLSTDEMKKSVKEAGKFCKEQVSAGAPVRTGKYKKSWKSKTTSENANAIEVTVYSSNRYQLAHLLEHGHAKRGGGRVRAIPHIAPAEEAAEDKLLKDIEKALGG